MRTIDLQNLDEAASEDGKASSCEGEGRGGRDVERRVISHGSSSVKHHSRW